MTMEEIAVFWFRRDLRLQDNNGLSKALASGVKVLPVFIFDTTILSRLEDPFDRRVNYIHQALTAMNEELQKHRSALKTFYGSPATVFEELRKTYKITAVYCNEDYEPEAIDRDNQIAEMLSANGISFYAFKDQVIFAKNEIVKQDGSPYTVYTPYSNRWKAVLSEQNLPVYKTSFDQFLQTVPTEIIPLSAIGFMKTDAVFSAPRMDLSVIADYDKYRDFPGMNYTSRLGVALRFGTISIRQCVRVALKNNETWLNELIWREFFMQILYHFPKVINHCFKEKYEYIQWRNNEEEFQRWCEGRTGYPVVDAGMRELNQTGFMHNRVRMIVASFLTKHLLIDWRWGAAYFAQKLLDYDLSANNGNWQWAAGCGCDAAPYFRIFNPSEQTKKFDKDLSYVRKWNPGFELNEIPLIVEHVFARQRALETYKKALG